MFSKKRILAIVMSLMMVLSMLPSMAFADGTVGITVADINIKKGETKTVEAVITGTETPENYHVHWDAKGGKKNYEITTVGPRTITYYQKGEFAPSQYFRADVYEGATEADCTGNKVATTDVTVNVTVENPNLHPKQGLSQQIQWIAPPLDLTKTVESAQGDFFNVIKDPIDGTQDNIFSFLFTSGTGSWSDTAFIEGALPYMHIVDKDGNKVPNAIEYVSGSSLEIKIKIPAGTLKAKGADANYTLVFEPSAGMKGKNSLGCTVEFQFTVKAEEPEVVPTTITLNKTAMTLKVGDVDTSLVATVTPEGKTVKWASSDAEVVKVGQNNGKLTALAAGTATITATTEDGVSATCVVTVEAEEPEVIPTTITLNKSEMTLKVDDVDYSLIATVTPEGKTVKWTSSDDSIVKVGQNTGKLTALAAGTATITATTEDGVSASCVVTVEEDTIIPPTGDENGQEPEDGNDDNKPDDDQKDPADKDNRDDATETGDMDLAPYFLIMLIAMAVAIGAVNFRRQKQ